MPPKSFISAKTNSKVEIKTQNLLTIITECAYKAKLFIFNTFGILTFNPLFVL